MLNFFFSNIFRSFNFNLKSQIPFFDSNLKFKNKYFFLKFYKIFFKNQKELFFSFFQTYQLNFYFNSFFFIFLLKKLPFYENIDNLNNNTLFFKSVKIVSSVSNNSNSFLNYLNTFSVKTYLNSFFFLRLKNLNYYIKYSVSDFFKYLNNYSLQTLNILFLRKNKVFNKGRYSRNRQYYRTGVYWCLYVNIVAVVGIYFWFYRFNMNFGYLWWILYFFLFSLFFSRSYSLNVFGLKRTFLQIFKSFFWILNIFSSFFISFLNFFKIFISK